ncbi:MAG: YihA family ribosome biogenesis GTP-binding protein [Chitinophagales bacterium]|nr:YihA family ribosome biogenesis GTP-binding protein [Chitinophagales bacterium]
MIIHSADFVSSYVNWLDCPKENLPEYAFIGRSNVGKSSLINMLTDRNSLAKISNTPGKTQCINFFLINEEWHLVDLPGYGYAKVSKKEREKWLQFTKAYIGQRKQLLNVFLLIDTRIPPQDIDIEFANWMGGKGIPFSIVFTKNDKPKKTAKNIEAFNNELLKHWDETPVSFITSSAKRTGREDILDYIDEINQTLLQR